MGHRLLSACSYFPLCRSSCAELSVQPAWFYPHPATDLLGELGLDHCQLICQWVDNVNVRISEGVLPISWATASPFLIKSYQ